MYESIGNAVDQQDLLDLVQKLLCVEDADMPNINALRVRISRQKWISGGDIPDVAAQVFGKNSDKSKVDTSKVGVRKGFELIVSESVQDMSKGQDGDEETTEEIKARHNKYMETFLKKVLDLRLVVRERHIDQLAQANAFIEKALELIYAPIELGAEKKEFEDSIARYEFGMQRFRHGREIVGGLSELHLNESIVLGLDYNVGGVGDERVDQAKALNEVRQNSKRLFEEQQRRYDGDRIVTQGRGERIAEALNASANDVDTATADDLIAEFDEETPLIDENSNVNNDFDDDERDFTEILPKG